MNTITRYFNQFFSLFWSPTHLSFFFFIEATSKPSPSTTLSSSVTYLFNYSKTKHRIFFYLSPQGKKLTADVFAEKLNLLKSLSCTLGWGGLAIQDVHKKTCFSLFFFFFQPLIELTRLKDKGTCSAGYTSKTYSRRNWNPESLNIALDTFFSSEYSFPILIFLENSFVFSLRWRLNKSREDFVSFVSLRVSPQLWIDKYIGTGCFRFLEWGVLA